MQSRVRTRSTIFRYLAVILVMILAALMTTPTASAAPPLSGAIFTTDSTCSGVNLNLFTDKDAVYLNGGPGHPGAAGLPDGNYYVQVTEPNGAVLGKSLTPTVTAVDGEFAACYQLAAVVLSASSGHTAAGYDTTTNGGGVYKVWVSSEPTFSPSSSKTDNFKVESDGQGAVPARLEVKKFYDANANGIDDDGISISGWQIRIVDGVDYIRYTPVDILLAPDEYTVTESSPLEANWAATTATWVPVTLAAGDHEIVVFGNLCLGAGGGKTLGYWSNKNGQADFGLIAAPGALASLAALNLRRADGLAFAPATYAAYRTWLLSASATNMAYMLSAQLSAMQLNVLSGKVSASAMIRAEGTMSANPLGYATVGAVIAEAQANLLDNGLVLAGSSQRELYASLKNALDAANNNLNFVQSSPCAFSFSD